MLNGHDFGSDYNFDDSLGQFYVAAFVIWTFCIVGGLLLLWKHRNSVAVRIRRFNLLASAVIVIHIYVSLIFLVYPLNGAFTCGIEFWVMNTILPFGIALFQGELCRISRSFDIYQISLLTAFLASNIQLLSIYEEQEYLAKSASLGEKKRRFRYTPRAAYLYWKQLSTIQKTTLGIAIAGAVQVCLRSKDNK